MKKYLQGVCVGLCLAVPALITGCSTYDSGGGVAYYDYDYYPDWDVYYYPHGHVYYWNESGAWRSGERLPEHYHGHAMHTEHLHLHSQQPWNEHNVMRSPDVPHGR